MDSSLSITVTADISGLEAAMDAAATSVDSAAKGFASSFQRTGKDLESFADKIVDIERRKNEAILKGEEQLNASKLALGQESLGAFTDQAEKLAKKKYDADLAALKQEQAAGKISHAEFTASLALLDQQYANKKAQIFAETAEKQKQINAKELSDFVSAKQSELQQEIAARDEQFRMGAISASERAQSEQALTTKIQKEIDDRLEFDMAALDVDSAAYEAAERQKEKIDREFANRHRQITSEAASEEQQVWSRATQELMSAEDTLVRNILTKRQSLGADLLQLSGQLIQRELADDLKLWTQKALIALLGQERIKVTEQGGFLYNLLFNRQDVAQTQVAETAKTGAVVGGVAARTVAEKAGATQGLAAQATADSTAIMNSAYTGAAGAYSAVAQIPYIGPFIAPAAAVATFAGIMAFDVLTSMDVGAWELPSDMPAMLHKGEMVVPRDFASGLRANGGVGGEGVTFNTHYYPTINMRDPASLKELLQKGGSELFDAIQRGYRTGLPMRPSMAPSY